MALSLRMWVKQKLCYRKHIVFFAAYSSKPQRGEKMVDYIETFKIDGMVYGIEDLTAPGDHFIHTEPYSRYQLWRGGCGIGNADTIAEARTQIHEYAKRCVSAALKKASNRVSELTVTATKLGSDPFNLCMFLVKK